MNKQTETTTVAKPVIKPKPANKPLIDSGKKNINIPDSSTYKDSLLKKTLSDSLRKDSLIKANQTKKVQIQVDTSTYKQIMYHAYLPFTGSKEYMISLLRKPEGGEILFYSVMGIVFLLAFIIVAFPRYFHDVYRIFFQTAFRQKQTKEQLTQNYIAEILMNLLFVVGGGMLLSLVATKQNWVHINFWSLFLYSSILLAAVYMVKFAFLKFSGWLFNVSSITEIYSFIVFITNKILAILFVPMLLITAFALPQIVSVTLIVLLSFIGIVFVYRYVVSLGTIRNNLKVNALHFFLYLCAVEILPLALLYKAILNFVNG